MNAPTSLTALCDATIFTGESMTEGHALLIKDSLILDIVGQNHVPADAVKVDCRDQILTAGFIDAQVNGGGNTLFNNSPTTEAALSIAKAHAHYGTTSLLLTCITDRPEVTQQAVRAVRTARQYSSSILGIHIEGPHLGTERRGVHKTEYIRTMTANDAQVYKREGDEIVLMTLAPETVSAELIAKLSQQGIIVSLGHTSASSEQIRTALTAGATGFTHLFNGMGGINAREPGPAGIALDDPTSWCSLIADGHHVSAELIRLALRAKPKGKIFLVSDAMPPAATDNPQPFLLYGETIRMADGRCINSEGKLAGAAMTMLDAVRHCAIKIGVSLEESFRMASTYPARFLGLDKKLGRLLPSYAADIVALDPALNLKSVWVDGAMLN